MRVILLGNHTVAVRALGALCECAEVCAVVAHPPDPEDGTRYASLFAEARRAGLRATRLAGDDPALFELVKGIAPEVLMTVDYRYLLSTQLIAMAKVAAINLHPGLLPGYRGRAPVNWAILHGETRLGLTAHFIDAGADTGDIIAQEAFDLREDEDAGDALEKLYPMYARMTRQVMGYCQSGNIPRRRQNHAAATTYPRRRPEDGAIDWTRSAVHVHRLVRAVAAPYPGAFGWIDGRKLIVWQARVVHDADRAEPGRITAVDGSEFTVSCGDGTLRVTRHAIEGTDAAGWTPRVGHSLAIEEAVIRA